MTSAAPTDLDAPPADAPRFLRAFWRLVRWALPVQFRYFGLYEYRIAAVFTGPICDLQAMTDTIAVGLDDIPKVPAWPGVAGAQPQPIGGSRVLVQFINGNGARPVVVAWAPAGDSGWVPEFSILDGRLFVSVGPSANTVALANGSTALALAPPIVAWAAGVNTALASAGHPTALLANPATTKVTGV